FPSVQRLARARESSVLAAWSGLGYYRRARMLRRAATEIASKHRGQFPDTAAELRELPGIGPYPAAAIASICLGERIAVVDGNGSVFLIHRTQHSSLMPGMWELPEIPSANGSGDSWITVRHSITTTDYLVRVVKGRAPDGTQGSWVRVSRLAELPLTGLARKILRVAKVI